jgi:ribonuclease E
VATEETGEPAEAAGPVEAREDGESEREEEPDTMQARGEPNGDAERRRRRRGRRGGRRSRRDGEGDTPAVTPPAAEAAAGWQDWAEGPPQADAVPHSVAAIGERAEEAVPHAAQEPTPSAPVDELETPAVAAPSRRRSTVREPAPVLVADRSTESVAPADAHHEAETVAPPAEPAPAGEPDAADDADRPRRTGWWARRVFGKG